MFIMCLFNWHCRPLSVWEEVEYVQNENEVNGKEIQSRWVFHINIIFFTNNVHNIPIENITQLL